MENFTNAWIERLRKGDDKAFAFLYQCYSKPLWAHLIRMLGEEETAREILQETFLLVIKKLDFYQEKAGMENGFRSWIYRIATNRAIDEIRKRKSAPTSIEGEEASQRDEPSRILSNTQTARTLEALINRLPAKQRTFLNLKVVEEMNYKEIADICGCNVNTVKQGIFRARASLKDLLKKEGVLV